MNNLMEWSRKVINSIMTKNKDPKYLYEVNIVLKPNPLNYDGMDEVMIEIFQENQFSPLRGRQLYKNTKGWCINLEEAMKDIEAQLL
jgi:hypothetical protein